MRAGLVLIALLASPPLLAVAAEVDVPARPGALVRAVAEAAPGDLLRLAAGSHEGPVRIDRLLTLDGGGEAALQGSGTGSVITVTAAGVIVRGLTITGSGSSHETIDAGVSLTEAAAGAVVEGNRILGNLYGVDIHGARDAVVHGNLIEGRRDHRMNDRGNGVYVWNAPGAVVDGNMVRWGRDGVFVNLSRDNAFRNNRFEDLRFAVHYMYANQGELTGNLSTRNHVGYALMFSRGLVVRGNASIGDRDHGVMLNYVNDAQIDGNLVRDGGEKCLFMYNANKNTLRANRFEGCPIGIHFTAGSARNAIFENAFIGNRTQVKYVGSRRHDWSFEGRGNFWSDHAAYDVNGDGLADQAYRPNDIIDQVLWTQPSAKLLLGSPAVQLIRWAQQTFPALLPGGVVDTAPLMRPVETAAPDPQMAPHTGTPAS